MLALVFPTVFALGAFAYVSWVFPGSGWSFLAAPAESLAGWAADAVQIFRLHRLAGAQRRDRARGGAGARRADRAASRIGWVRERRPLVAPPLVFAGAVIGAAVVTVATGLFGNPGAARRRGADPRRRDRGAGAAAAPSAGASRCRCSPPAGSAASSPSRSSSRAPRCSFAPRSTAALAEPARLDALALGGATLEARRRAGRHRQRAGGRARPRPGARPDRRRRIRTSRWRCCFAASNAPSSRCPTRMPQPASATGSTRRSRCSTATARRATGSPTRTRPGGSTPASQQQGNDHANSRRRRLRGLARPHRGRADGGGLRAGGDRRSPRPTPTASSASARGPATAPRRST